MQEATLAIQRRNASPPLYTGMTTETLAGTVLLSSMARTHSRRAQLQKMCQGPNFDRTGTSRRDRGDRS